MSDSANPSSRRELESRRAPCTGPSVLLLAALTCSSCSRQTDDPKARTAIVDAGASDDAGPRLWCVERSCFPEQPISDSLLPVADVERFFDWPEAPDSAGPCIYEPSQGALFPRNSIRPRIRFEPSKQEDIWEIRWSLEAEEHDLVVYTSSLSRSQGHVVWPMPKDIWEGVATHAPGAAVRVRVRGASTSDPSVRSESRTEFRIAPVPAEGAIVYWSTDGAFGGGGETTLRGFSMGDEATVVVLEPGDVEEYPSLNEFASPKVADGDLDEGRVRCIGCHTSTPDGDAVAFVDSWPWNSVLASIKEGERGVRPSYVTQPASRIIQQPWQGSPTFSKGHWDTGKRWMVQSFGSPEPGWQPAPTDADGWNASGADQLVWFDLDYQSDTLPDSGRALSEAVVQLRGVAFDFIETEGDDNGAVNPDWSHSGEWIAYVSAERTLDGHSGGRIDEPDIEFDTDIRLVPFADGAGGPSEELDGAASPEHREYYPDFSADDELIAFTRSEGTTGPAYYRRDGEIFVVPTDGGDAVRLAANDPPSCAAEQSPGVHNSWPKWAPTVEDDDGRHYYWLIFSSARRYVGQFDLVPDEYSPGGPSSQLYIAAVIVDDAGMETFPAVYLWNQTTNSSNLTPAWDEFQIPKVEVH